MNRKKIETVLMILFILGLTVYYLQEYHFKNTISKNYKETIGTIIDYYEVFPSTHYLTYEYTISNKKYQKRINPEIEFKGCPDSKDCVGKKFLVHYEPNKPENSIILLDNPK